MNIIEVKGIVKRFGKNIALDNINFKIKEGEFFSLLGPNGAGKTTLISILTSILKPTDGTALVNGYNVVKNSLEVRKSIGIVFQEPSLDDLLTAWENLYVHSVLYNMPKKIVKKRIIEMLEIVGLIERKDDQVKTYSGGMKRRLEIARGLLHMPKILFLDEPTLGLDPVSRRQIWNYIRKMKKEMNLTIILTTHYMDEAENLSDTVAIINKGKIIEIDSINNLKKKIGEEIVIVNGDIDLETVKNMDFVENIDFVDGRYFISSKNLSKHLNDIIKSIKKIDDIEIKKVSLEDVFIKLTGKKIEELDEV